MGKLWRYNVVFGGLLVLGVLAGCAVEHVDQLAEVQQQTGGFDEQYNGRSVVGPEFETAQFLPASAKAYFSVGTDATRNGEPEPVVLSEGASLKALSGNPDLRGVVLSSGLIHLTIASARSDGAITHYALDLQVDKGPVSRVCDDAIPLTGLIDRTGAHLASSDDITFACSKGAAHKCAVFGYPAGLPGGDMWGVHQACIQMELADYCGNGVTNTRTGTQIAFFDNAGVYTAPPGTQLPLMTAALWPPNTTDYYFEAAFRSGHGPAMCNARARWPLITDSCIAAIPDCPGDTVDQLFDPGGAMLLVASRYNQLRLDRWRSNGGTGPDRVSTVRGYYNYGDAVSQPPWAGYVHESTDGMLLRIPPTSVPPGGIVAVSLFQHGNDYFVARSNDPRFTGPAYVNLGEEGRVYLSSSDVLNPRALRLYKHRTTGDHTSTTADPVDVAAQGYDPVLDPSGGNLIGWIAGLP
jgi:hypothetical protein